MDALIRLCPDQAAAAFVAVVLVQVTVIILAAWCVARFGARWNAAWRYCVYLTAVVCTLVSPFVAWTMRSAEIATVTLPVVAQPRIVPQAAPASPPQIVVENVAVELHAATSAGPASLPVPNAAETTSTPASPTSSLTLVEVVQAIGGLALVAWLAGIIFHVARWLHGLGQIAELRRSSRKIDDVRFAAPLRQVRLALGADRLPELAVSPVVDRPIMVGMLRPLVVLPESLVDSLSGSDLIDVLVHECAHAVCRHQFVGFLQRTAGAIFWPHPLVRLLNSELARAREEVCDNYVLRRGAAPDYARTLLTLSQTLAVASSRPTALGLFHCRWRLEDRIADLLDRRRVTMIRVSRWTVAFISVSFFLAALTIGGIRFAQAAPPSDGNSDGAAAEQSEKDDAKDEKTDVKKEEKEKKKEEKRKEKDEKKKDKAKAKEDKEAKDEDQGEDDNDDIDSAVDELAAEIHGAVEEARKAAKDASKEARAAVKEATKEAREALEQARQEIRKNAGENGQILIERAREMVKQSAGAASQKLDVRQESKKTFRLNPNGTFTLQNVEGQVVVTGWERNEVEITSMIRAASDEDAKRVNVEIKNDDDRIDVRTKLESAKNVAVDYVVKVPFSVRVKEIKNVNGAVSLSDLKGDVNVSAVNGSISANALSGECKLESVNGAVTCNLPTGEVKQTKISTVNGPITISLNKDVADVSLTAKSLNGKLQGPFSEKKEKIGGGPSSVRLGKGKPSLNLESVNGDISLISPDDKKK